MHPTMKNHLAVAVATFVLLDLCALAFSYSIARQVERDAVAINLAGRQRMLSQRVTKAAVLATAPTRSEAQRSAFAQEADEAYQLFRKTLAAFAKGGDTEGGDGRTVHVDAVNGKAALLVGEVQGLLNTWPEVPADAEQLAAFTGFMIERNAGVLEAMNRLTTVLEHQSVTAVSRLRVAQGLAFSLSLANFIFILFGMHRARLVAEVQSETDALTGLRNRGGFYTALDRAMAWHVQSAEPLGVLLLDLNGFKAVNDTQGHAAGDATLREVARRLVGLRGKGWICARLGGDEFAILCPGLNAEQLAAAGQHVSKVLAGVPGGALEVSASVGWTHVAPGQTPDEVVAAADAAMYAAKNEHRLARTYRDGARRPTLVG